MEIRCIELNRRLIAFALTATALLAGCSLPMTSGTRAAAEVDHRPIWVQTGVITASDDFAKAYPPGQYVFAVSSSTQANPTLALEEAKGEALKSIAGSLSLRAPASSGTKASSEAIESALSSTRGYLNPIASYAEQGAGSAGGSHRRHYAFALDQHQTGDALQVAADAVVADLKTVEQNLRDPGKTNEMSAQLSTGLQLCARHDGMRRVAAGIGKDISDDSTKQFRANAEKGIKDLGLALEQKGSEDALHQALALYETGASSLKSGGFDSLVRSVKGQLPCTACHRGGKCSACDGKKGAIVVCTQCKGTQRYTIACNSCNGDGRVACSACGGHGSTSSPCMHCQGGQLTCTSCGGKGKSGGEECMSCSGRGSVTCVGCGGSGSIGTQRCLVCGGRGQQNCLFCAGRGHQIEIPCFTCHGSGRERCDTCNGRGEKADSCRSCGGSGRSGSCPACRGGGRQEVACQTCKQGKVFKNCDSCKGNGRCPSCHGFGNLLGEKVD